MKRITFSFLILICLTSCGEIKDEIKRKVAFLKHKDHIEFIQAHPDSLASAKTLAIMSTTFGRDKTRALYNQLSERVQGSEHGKVISKYLSVNVDPKIGDPFVDFEMPNADGQTEKLSDLKGKVILLEFWASWCGPCAWENPNLKEAYENYKEQGFEIFAVSMDFEKDSWLRAIEEQKLDWHHVSEMETHFNTAALIYGINGIPDNILIDPNGIIVARDLRGEELNEKLAQLMQDTGTHISASKY